MRLPAGLGARLLPLLARQREEEARVAAEDAEFDRVVSMGLGPQDPGTPEQEVGQGGPGPDRAGALPAVAGACFILCICALAGWVGGWEGQNNLLALAKGGFFCCLARNHQFPAGPLAVALPTEL